jgi:hypothetical protein
MNLIFLLSYDSFPHILTTSIAAGTASVIHVDVVLYDGVVKTRPSAGVLREENSCGPIYTQQQFHDVRFSTAREELVAATFASVLVSKTSLVEKSRA